MKKLNKLFFLVFIFVSSCDVTKYSLTKKLWTPSYKEEIKEFIFSQNRRDIILLGEKYNYSLQDNSGILQNILPSRYHRFLYIDSADSFFDLYENNAINGMVTIRINTASPPPDAYNFFIASGFQVKENRMMFLKLPIGGVRYQAFNDDNIRALPLNRIYEIEIRSQGDYSGDVGRVILTPLTLIVDAIVIIGRVLIWPFSSN